MSSVSCCRICNCRPRKPALTRSNNVKTALIWTSSIITRSQWNKVPSMRRIPSSITISSGIFPPDRMSGAVSSRRWINKESIEERVLNGTKTSLNALIVLAASLVLGGVVYTLYDAISRGESHFVSEAFERIKQDPRCIAVLGPPEKMKQVANAQPPSSGAPRRVRSTNVTTVKGRDGREWMSTRFWILGERGTADAFASVAIDRRRNWEWQSLGIDVPQKDNQNLQIIIEDGELRRRQQSQLHDQKPLSNWLTKVFKGT